MERIVKNLFLEYSAVSVKNRVDFPLDDQFVLLGTGKVSKGTLRTIKREKNRIYLLYKAISFREGHVIKSIIDLEHPSSGYP